MHDFPYYPMYASRVDLIVALGRQHPGKTITFVKDKPVHLFGRELTEVHYVVSGIAGRALYPFPFAK
jgi:hypothetical protein